jgi:hypothetical protein
LSGYGDNASMFEALDTLLSDSNIVSRIAAIGITSAASPVASREYNRQLSWRRGLALKEYILNHYPYLDENEFYIDSKGIDWDGFRAVIEADKFLPSRSKVLALLDTGFDQSIVLARLRTVGGKSGYNYLLQTIYPQLQYATCHIRLDDGADIPSGSGSPLKMYLEKTACDTVYCVVRDTIWLPVPNVSPVEPVSATDSDVPLKAGYYFGLKTNLLYDAALLPNLSAEFPFGNKSRWSAVVEGNWSWWTSGKPIDTYHRIQAAGLEVRRWFASSAPLTGHAAGIYALGGTYDVRLQPRNTDSKGWLSNWSYSYGLSYAYSKPLSRHFNIEFGLAAGYLDGRYYDYKFCVDSERWEWTAIRQRHYWGITRAEISLVWLIGRKNLNNKNIFNTLKEKGGLK